MQAALAWFLHHKRVCRLPKTLTPLPYPARIVLHLGYLDGIRGLAAFYVVLHHLYVFQYSMSAQSGLKGLLVNWLLYGHLAVDVFIVLSGFCLVLPVARTGQLQGGAMPFFRKRMRRLLPPFCAALALCIAGLCVVRFVRHDIHSLFSFQGLLVNALLLQDLFPSFDYQFDPPMWSVAAEWKIYFLFPLLLLAWKRYRFTGLLGSAAALAIAATAALHWERPAMPLGHTCPWYIFLFGIGMAAGLLAVSEKQRNYASLSGWGIAVFLPLLILLLARYPVTSQGEDAIFVPHLPAIDTVTGALTASLLILLAQSRLPGPAGVRSFLSQKPLVFLGTFAYSLYLVHFPLISSLILFAHKLPGLHQNWVLQTFLVVFGLPLIAACAYVFHLAFERPWMTKPGIKIKTTAQAEAVAACAPVFSFAGTTSVRRLFL